MKICLENLFDQPEEDMLEQWDWVMSEYSAEFLGFCLDAGHGYMVWGEKLEGIIKKYNESVCCKKKIIEILLYNCNFIQVVGLHVKDFLCDRIPCVIDTVIVRDAFLPPPLEDEPKILATYPDEMRNFMEVQRPLIVANAFQLADWNGIDLYGLDMCIELIHRLKKKYPSVGLLFALANEQYRTDYYAKMRGLIADYGLQRNVYFLTDQHELWPILKDCDVMVRPTCTDGYGVSVAEALYFNRPAVASDVCKRPEGCAVFRNRDMDDFEAKVRQVLERGK